MAELILEVATDADDVDLASTVLEPPRDDLKTWLQRARSSSSTRDSGIGWSAGCWRPWSRTRDRFGHRSCYGRRSASVFGGIGSIDVPTRSLAPVAGATDPSAIS
jgi:hypothetical protein